MEKAFYGQSYEVKILWSLLVFWICACYYELVDIFWSVKRFLRKEEKWAESHRTKEKETLLTIRSCIQEMWTAGRFSKTIHLPASFWEIIRIFHCLRMFSLKISRMYPAIHLYLQQCAGSDKRNLQEDFMDFTNKDECARGRGKRDDGRDWRSWNGVSVWKKSKCNRKLNLSKGNKSRWKVLIRKML